MHGEHDVRPWGSYTVLEDARDHKVKRIEVDPGRRLSYQRHARRAEHWFIVSGRARVTLDGEEHELEAGDAIDIPRGAAHRIANPGAGPMTFIEVQHGDYFGEDDIERLDDDFGRAS
jgi:mannose-6-phosphate isomerase